MTGVVFLTATGIATYCACRHLTRQAAQDCPRGGTHRTITPAGDVAPHCITCGHRKKEAAR